MSDETTVTLSNLIEITSEIVAAYVSNNSVRSSDLTEVIASVHAAVAGLARGDVAVAEADTFEKPSPAQVRRSIAHDGITSFIDGRSYKTLKRHLTAHGLDPHGYRERYGLPADYPMVCPSYSEQRSSLAKAIGLGVPGAGAARTDEAPKGKRAA